MAAAAANENTPTTAHVMHSVGVTLGGDAGEEPSVVSNGVGLTAPPEEVDVVEERARQDGEQYVKNLASAMLAARREEDVQGTIEPSAIKMKGEDAEVTCEQSRHHYLLPSVGTWMLLPPSRHGVCNTATATGDQGDVTGSVAVKRGCCAGIKSVATPSKKRIEGSPSPSRSPSSGGNKHKRHECIATEPALRVQRPAPSAGKVVAAKTACATTAVSALVVPIQDSQSPNQMKSKTTAAPTCTPVVPHRSAVASSPAQAQKTSKVGRSPSPLAGKSAVNPTAAVTTAPASSTLAHGSTPVVLQRSAAASSPPGQVPKTIKDGRSPSPMTCKAAVTPTAVTAAPIAFASAHGSTAVVAQRSAPASSPPAQKLIKEGRSPSPMKGKTAVATTSAVTTAPPPSTAGHGSTSVLQLSAAASSSPAKVQKSIKGGRSPTPTKGRTAPPAGMLADMHEIQQNNALVAQLVAAPAEGVAISEACARHDCDQHVKNLAADMLTESTNCFDDEVPLAPPEEEVQVAFEPSPVEVEGPDAERTKHHYLLPSVGTWLASAPLHSGCCSAAVGDHGSSTASVPVARCRRASAKSVATPSTKRAERSPSPPRNPVLVSRSTKSGNGSRRETEHTSTASAQPARSPMTNKMAAATVLAVTSAPAAFPRQRSAAALPPQGQAQSSIKGSRSPSPIKGKAAVAPTAAVKTKPAARVSAHVSTGVAPQRSAAAPSPSAQAQKTIKANQSKGMSTEERELEEARKMQAEMQELRRKNAKAVQRAAATRPLGSAGARTGGA